MYKVTVAGVEVGNADSFADVWDEGRIQKRQNPEAEVVVTGPEGTWLVPDHRPVAAGSRKKASPSVVREEPRCSGRDGLRHGADESCNLCR